MTKTLVGVRLSDWFLRDIVGDCENKTERIKELMIKGHLYEKESIKNQGYSSANMREMFNPVRSFYMLSEKIPQTL